MAVTSRALWKAERGTIMEPLALDPAPARSVWAVMWDVLRGHDPKPKGDAVVERNIRVAEMATDLARLLRFNDRETNEEVLRLVERLLDVKGTP